MRYHANHYYRLILALAIGSSSSLTFAGSFSSSSESNPNIITHPEGYTGTGGQLNLTVCIADDSQDQTALEIPVKNAVNTWNGFQPINGNIVSNTLTGFDIESVLLHELGHCIGLGHTNLGSEVSSSNRNFSRSANGANNSFSFNSGADNIAGSADDIRGDDVNLIWFRRSNNNPFGMAQTVDTSTYSVMLADLPIGDTYAAIAGRNVAAELGIANTEAVMHQGTFSQEAQRSLGFDDAATLRIGMSGEDEIQGTNDDYSLSLSYTGIQDANNCDIPIRVVPGSSSFASCFASSTSSQLPTDHRRLLFTRIELGGNVDWYFNDIENNAPTDTDGDGLSDTLEDATCTTTNDADTDDDGLSDGVEDANQDGVVDIGETDPCDADSDNDNIQDGTELGIVAGVTDTNLSIFIPDSDPTTTTLPLASDTDGDGLDDGVEDTNLNGQVDPGESDPNDENSPPCSGADAPPTGCSVRAYSVPVAQSNHDARMETNGSDTVRIDLNGLPMGNNNEFMIGTIFRAPIAPGSNVISARLVFTATSNASAAGLSPLIVNAEASDDADAFSSTAGDLSTANRPRVTGPGVPVTFDVPVAANNTAFPVDGGNLGFDVKPLVEQVIARPGWNYNNKIAFFVTNGATNIYRQAHARDANNGREARLVLEVQGDSDGDGLSDTLENGSCTLANDADTDDDGLADGVEDANQNGVVDTGETDPCNADSDNDNIQDGTELGIVAGVTDTNLSIFIPDSDPTTTTLPLESDTDGDGLDDGVEDPNFNGEVDPGESDPNDENSPPSPTTVPLMPLLFQLLASGLLLLVSLVGLKSLRSK